MLCSWVATESCTQWRYTCDVLQHSHVNISKRMPQSIPHSLTKRVLGSIHSICLGADLTVYTKRCVWIGWWLMTTANWTMLVHSRWVHRYCQLITVLATSFSTCSNRLFGWYSQGPARREESEVANYGVPQKDAEQPRARLHPLCCLQAPTETMRPGVPLLALLLAARAPEIRLRS